MNDFQMTSLTKDNLAIRRAEADRSRLAHSGQAETATKRPSGRSLRPRRSTASLGALFHRVALF